MSIKPILFNTEMVRAIEAGNKTVTRRVIKPQPLYAIKQKPSGDYADYYKTGEYGASLIPPCALGDILWVRETILQGKTGYTMPSGEWTEEWTTAAGFEYVADDAKPHWADESHTIWMCTRPSIHMPKGAARLFLSVKDVRVERLCDITVDGALAEGTPDVEKPPICRKEITYPNSFPRGFDEWDEERREDWIQGTARARYIGWCEYANRLFEKFKTVWNGTIKSEDLAAYGWDANPWVWVIEFERCDKPAGL